jgi:hypothetical protein
LYEEEEEEGEEEGEVRSHIVQFHTTSTVCSVIPSGYLVSR